MSRSILLGTTMSNARYNASPKFFIENEKYQGASYTLGQSGLSACTISIASPAVITQTNAFLGGEEVFLQTTGALPTGLAVNTTYFVASTGLSSSAYGLSLTRGGAAINTSGTQSGNHTAGRAKSAATVGPIIIATGSTLTIPGGQRLVIQ